MSAPRSLITTEQLAVQLGQPGLRVYDCTTYLEPMPAGSDTPYTAVPGRHTFEDGHIPGADFLDLQGEFSDRSTHLRFMMPAVSQLEDAFGRHGVGSEFAGRALQHRQQYVGDPLLVDAALAWLRRRWCSTAASTNGRRRAARSSAARPAAIRRQRSRRSRCPAFSSTSRRCRRRTAIAATVVVNALGPQFHRGQEPGRYGRPGRIPGSVNVPAATLFDPASKTFVAPADAQAKFEQQGVTKDKTIVCYCGGGISATIDLFMLHQLGYEKAHALRRLDGRMGQGSIAADRDRVRSRLHAGCSPHERSSMRS